MASCCKLHPFVSTWNCVLDHHETYFYNNVHGSIPLFYEDTEKNLGQDSQFSVRESNLGHFEYEGVLTIAIY
jgi:hypothetical protein